MTDLPLPTRIVMAEVASCTCLVKSPAWQAHNEDCRYRVLAESHELIHRLLAFHQQVMKAAGSLEGLPDGHAFELVWAGDGDDDKGKWGETMGGPPDIASGFITAGMIRRAIDPNAPALNEPFPDTVGQEEPQ